ncbi:unnamed protein product [Withania somnifera]
MAFVGYLESVSNLHSAEIRCIWLSRLVDDLFKLPSVEKINCISTFSINLSDEICQEMGWISWRKTNWLAEAFSPYNSEDYAEGK